MLYRGEQGVQSNRRGSIVVDLPANYSMGLLLMILALFFYERDDSCARPVDYLRCKGERGVKRITGILITCLGPKIVPCTLRTIRSLMDPNEDERALSSDSGQASPVESWKQ